MSSWHIALWPPPWDRSHPLGKLAAALYFVLLIPVSAVLALLVIIVRPFEWWLDRGKPPRLTQLQVADAIESFILGTGGPWDWDDFISVPIRDVELDAIRERCARLDSEFPPERPGQFCGRAGMAVLRGYVDELRRSDG